MSLDIQNGIEIQSVDEYIKEIYELTQQYREDNLYSQFFFRGQAVSYWDIKPSVFRNDMLSIEHSLLKESLRRVPNEFKGLMGAFEIMEKCQHYGQCTRLLDVTTNPLVALYFACEKYPEETGNKKPQGVILLRNDPMPYMYDHLYVKVISMLANYEMNGNYTIEDVVEKLYEDNILTQKQKNRWLDRNGILEFIEMCQNTYTVLPIVNNERLSRQSGAFLLPGKFNFVSHDEDLQKALIIKAECNLRDEFEKTFFYIEDENKEIIREDLENYNISEANLFPELEYQLRYIRKCNEMRKRAVDYFKRFQIVVGEKKEADEYLPYSPEIVRACAKEEIKDIELIEDVIKIFNQNQDVDWIKRESVLSKIKIILCKELIKNQYKKFDAEEVAGKIVKNVIEKHRKR